MAQSNRPGRTLHQRRSPTRPTHRIRRHHPGQPIQRADRCRIGSRAQDRQRSSKRNPVRCGHRGHRHDRRRHPHDVWTKNEEHPVRPQTGNHPPRRQCVHRRRMRQPKPAPNPPHHPLDRRRNHRPRQSDHPLLVPPSRSSYTNGDSSPTGIPSTVGSDSASQPCAAHRTSPSPTRPRSRQTKYPSARWFDASPGWQLHGILKVVPGTGDV